MKRHETKICGLAAVRARFERAPESVVRLFFDASTAKKVGAMCAALARARKVYRCVEAAELEKIAESIHHGGVVAVVDEPPPRAPTAPLASEWYRRRENLLVLDRVGNAHNLGAIARTAAFFGVPRLVIAGDATAARPGPAAYRVAEGGLDAIEVWTAPDIPLLLGMLARAGFEVLGAAARGGEPGPLGARPWALVLGNEEHGLSPAAESACTRLLTIPGSGKVESLNVSAAAAVLIHELSGRSAGAPRRA